MDNLKITFKLGSPVIISRFTSIDSILLAVFYKNKKNKTLKDAYLDTETDFLKKENGNISGSIWFIDKNTPIQLENLIYIKTPENKRMVKYFGVKKAEKIGGGSGAYKNYQIHEECYILPEIYFYVAGDKKKIENLCSQVTNIGHKTAWGYGKVTGFDIEKIDIDKGFLLNEFTPAKPLTLKWQLKNDRIALFRPYPPYWQKAGIVPCYMPHTSLVEILDDEPVKGNVYLENITASDFVYQAIKKETKYIGKINEPPEINKLEAIADNKEYHCMCCGYVKKKGYIAHNVKDIAGVNFNDFPFLDLTTPFICKECFILKGNDYLKTYAGNIIINNSIYKTSVVGKESTRKFKIRGLEQLGYTDFGEFLLDIRKQKPPYFITIKTIANNQHTIWKGQVTISNLMPVIGYGNTSLGKAVFLDTVLWEQAVEDLKELLKKYKKNRLFKFHLTNYELTGFSSGSFPVYRRGMTEELKQDMQDFWRKYDRGIRRLLNKVRI